MIKRVTGTLLLIAMIFTMAACGSEEEAADEDGSAGSEEKSVTVSIHDLASEDDGLTLLDGTWSSDYDADGIRFVATVADEEIRIHRMSESSCEICWVGTCPEPVGTDFESERAEYYVMEWDQTETLPFIYREEQLFFWYTDENGEKIGVYMSKVSDAVMMEVELENVPYVDMQDHSQDEKEDSKNEDEEENAADTPESVSEKPKVSDDTEPAEISTCAHSYGSGTVTKAATCTENGIRTYTCSKCGDITQSVIPATGHQYESEITKAATCGDTGVKVYTCTACGDQYSTTINATGDHQWVETTEEVTVNEQGHYETQTTTTEMYSCSACGYQSSSASDITAHINSEHGGEGECVGETITEDEDIYIVDTPAHTEEIVTGRICSVCGAEG